MKLGKFHAAAPFVRAGLPLLVTSWQVIRAVLSPGKDPPSAALPALRTQTPWVNGFLSQDVVNRSLCRRNGSRRDFLQQLFSAMARDAQSRVFSHRRCLSWSCRASSGGTTSPCPCWTWAVWFWVQTQESPRTATTPGGDVL